jgi:uncharacterized protein with ParB-like and HNH nuclease domain
MKKIDGSPKNLKQLLLNTKYSINYYQREYLWQRKQIEELIEDLTSEFLEFYNPSHARSDVQDYGTYFMGSIILTATKDNAIIDGQQRLTSLTLLLTYIKNMLGEMGKEYNLIQNMIFSESFGTKAFNINVKDRSECMQALYDGTEYDITHKSESVVNLYNRYQDIRGMFPEEIDGEALLYFADWLAERVYFIEIIAATEQDAHKVFININDRGLNLTSAEMLKGFLLSEIKEDLTREQLNQLWKNRIMQLKNVEQNGEDAFIKNWLRSQYAETIRESKAGSVNKDFDLIGGPFHKWVRDEKSKLGLSKSGDYEDFIKKFDRYASIYLDIKGYEANFKEEQKYIYYNAKLGFTFQPQLLLASICPDDMPDIVEEKLSMVSKYIDLLIYTRAVNYRSNNYSTIRNYIFNLSKKIRRKSKEELAEILLESYISLDYKLDAASISAFKVNAYTKVYIKHMLARITGFLEEISGKTSNYCDYVNIAQKSPYEIEHITSDHYEWFTDEYSTQEEFYAFRNNVGDLVLLNKHINASLNDKLFGYKVKKYCSNEGNIYAGSLAEITYKNNPKFNAYIKMNNIPFKSYTQFGKKEIIERNKLVARLVEEIWKAEFK